MSNKHYHNYSKPYKAPEVVEQTIPTSTFPTSTFPTSTSPVIEPEIPPVVDATVPVPDETIKPDVVESTPELPTTVTGVVSGCKKLNVRNKPSTSAAILTTINEGVEVEVGQPVATGEFYKVTLANGIVGYCMKKFITVK